MPGVFQGLAPPGEEPKLFQGLPKLLIGEPKPDIIGKAFIPMLNEFKPPRLFPQLLPVLPSMAPDITFIMTSIMRNMTLNMSSAIACAGIETGSDRAHASNSAARRWRRVTFAGCTFIIRV